MIQPATVSAQIGDMIDSLPDDKKLRVLHFINSINKIDVADPEFFNPIEDMMSRILDIPKEYFWEKTRERKVTYPRYLHWYILYNYYNIPCASIGRRYAFDHTTVIHGRKVIDDLLSYDDAVREHLDSVIRQIESK